MFSTKQFIGTFITKDNVNGLEQLLKKVSKIDLNDPIDNRGNTPLHIAAQYNAQKILNFLLTKQIDINKKNITGATALHMAVQMGNPDSIRILLHKGANPNIKDLDKLRPIDFLLIFEKDEKTCDKICKLFLDYKVDPLEPIPSDVSLGDEFDLFQSAMIKKKYALLEALLKYAPDSAFKSKCAIIPMVDDYKETTHLHKLLFPKNSREIVTLNLLHFATRESPQSITLLLKYGFDPLSQTSHGITALQMAEKASHPGNLQAMKEYIKSAQRLQFLKLLNKKISTMTAEYNKEEKSLINHFNPSEEIVFTSGEIASISDKLGSKLAKKLMGSKSEIKIDALFAAIMYRNEYIITQLLEQHEFDLSKKWDNRFTALQLMIKDAQLPAILKLPAVSKLIKEATEADTKQSESKEELKKEDVEVVTTDSYSEDIEKTVTEFKQLEEKLIKTFEEMETNDFVSKELLKKLNKRRENERNMISTGIQRAQEVLDKISKESNEMTRKSMLKKFPPAIAHVTLHLDLLKKVQQDAELMLDQAKQKQMQQIPEPVRKLKQPVNTKIKKKKKDVHAKKQVKQEIPNIEGEQKVQQVDPLNIYPTYEVKDNLIVTNKPIGDAAIQLAMQLYKKHVEKLLVLLINFLLRMTATWFSHHVLAC